MKKIRSKFRFKIPKLTNAMNPSPHPLLIILADPSVPLTHKSLMLREVLENITPQTEPMVKQVFEKLAQQSTESLYLDRVQKLDALLKEIYEGPMRVATFIELTQINGDGVPQALVSLGD